jgi:phospholipid/cholesterol/gamma-HCH transport system ATP-binding protein
VLVQTPLIEFRDVTKRFGTKTILDRINLQIYENQITTVIGKSGTGKSVLLKHIIGLLQPDEGVILFNGRPVSDMKHGEWDGYRSRISYLFQDNALFDSMTVFENVALPLRETTNLGKQEIAQRVMTRIEQTELADVADKYPSELSGGMQKRVALARALVTDPQIVLFDEPTTGQDPIRKNVILSMIAHYRRLFGFTAVLISHDIPDVFFISDRIILLWEGKAGFQGTYEEAVELRHPMIDEFLRSLEGFQDELTGLLSKGAFRSRYASMLPGGRKAGVSAVVFTVEFDLVQDNLGPQTAVEVLQLLGEYTNNHFGPLGGFSARHSRSQILTVLPRISLVEAQEMVDSFARTLNEAGLSRIEGLTQSRTGGVACFEILIQAGITGVLDNDDIDQIIQKAVANQRVVATFRCESGGDQA